VNRRLKFNIGMGAVQVTAVAVAGTILYGVLHRSERDHVVETANLVMAAAEATRAYTTTFIKPQLDKRLEIEFLPQSVPAFAATETIAALREQFPEYSYKEAALNPTNPRDRTSDWEADLVNAFRADAAQRQIFGERMQGPIRILYLAKPIKVSNPGCLACHGTPAAAPALMISLYGEVGGFGWKLDEIIGAQIVSVPLSTSDEAADRTFAIVMGALVLLALLALGVGNLLLGKSAAREAN